MAKSAGAKRGRKKDAVNGAASLIEALKFIALAQQKEGTPNQTHCVISNGRAMAFNGIFAVGHLIEDDLNACPHTVKMLDALGKCGENLAITQLDSGRLSIKSGAFKAFIQCAPFETIPVIEPDPPCADIDDRLKAGFALVSPILSETATRAICAGALLQANSIVGTNGAMLIEYWHGIDLPPGLLIPKATLQAIVKTPKKLVKFGFSDNSVTFFFEDNSFIKSQIYSERFPDYNKLFPINVNPWSVPKNFFDGLRAIQSLADDRVVLFDAEGFSVVDAQKDKAGTYEIEGLKAGIGFNIDFLLSVEMVFKQADFEAEEGKVTFFGENVRGMIMGVRR